MAVGCGLLALGILIGRSDALLPAAIAQDGAEVTPLSEEAANQIRSVNRALENARDELEREGRYVPATETLNAFLILSGGGDAVADLEAGNGVDPETFAALYAGQASPEVKQHLRVDEEGHLLYKNGVVRMYSKSRLKDLYDQRAQYVAAGR